MVTGGSRGAHESDINWSAIGMHMCQLESGGERIECLRQGAEANASGSAEKGPSLWPVRPER